jgi:hypothetical protein
VDFPRSARSSPTRRNRDHHLDFGDRGAAHSERSALRRSLELAAKRCYGNRAHFLQNGFRFGYPQIDWAGKAPGYVGTEFPILPFIAGRSFMPDVPSPSFAIVGLYFFCGGLSIVNSCRCSSPRSRLRCHC